MPGEYSGGKNEKGGNSGDPPSGVRKNIGKRKTKHEKKGVIACRKLKRKNPGGGERVEPPRKTVLCGGQIGEKREENEKMKKDHISR